MHTCRGGTKSAPQSVHLHPISFSSVKNLWNQKSESGRSSNVLSPFEDSEGTRPAGAA